jgi:glycine/D-amino acid oxidase-like deaminating enzyme
LGCASAARAPSIGRVVVIGGGYGGATAARYLRLWGGNIEVTLSVGGLGAGVRTCSRVSVRFVVVVAIASITTPTG